MNPLYYENVNPELYAQQNPLHSTPKAAEIEPDIVYHLISDKTGQDLTRCCSRLPSLISHEERVTLSVDVANCNGKGGVLK